LAGLHVEISGAVTNAYDTPHDPHHTTKPIPSQAQKQEESKAVLESVQALAAAGALKKWGAALEDLPQRSSVMVGELRMVGVKQPERIAQLSVRNDAAFLWTTVGVSSLLAVVLGNVLPGDWGFFSAYLSGAGGGGHSCPEGDVVCACLWGSGTWACLLVKRPTLPCCPHPRAGGISLGVLAIGSINPGLLQFAIDRFRCAGGLGCDTLLPASAPWPAQTTLHSHHPVAVDPAATCPAAWCSLTTESALCGTRPVTS
jgi:hypothetical protein